MRLLQTRLISSFIRDTNTRWLHNLPDLNLDQRKLIEKKWSEVNRELTPQSDSRTISANPMYILSMFPYPSGKLHMGHLRVYTVSDVLARYYHLKGHDVLHPFGWDSFGLPAENAAIDNKEEPSAWTNKYFASCFSHRQKHLIHEGAAAHPDYYKMTQWIFLKLLENNLAYQRTSLVNWDPVDRTVLADELIDSEGRSWRSGALVEKRPLRQWFLRTTAYSKSLLDGLHQVEKNEWRNVIQLQRGWLGSLTGTLVDFQLKGLDEFLTVYTEEEELVAADQLTHISVSADSVYACEAFKCPGEALNNSRKLVLVCDRPKLSVASCQQSRPWPEKLNLTAVHPLSGRELPVVYSPDSYWRSEEAAHPRPGLPQFSAVDASVAREFGFYLPREDTSTFSSKEEARDAFKKAEAGGYASSALRSDWLVSRQRYWGTPIPVVHCSSCGTVPVKESDLPIRLPKLQRAFERTSAPLKEDRQWRDCECPRCGAAAERETDTLDTFFDSSWYYLRYLDPGNPREPCSIEKSRRGMPVSIYVGGIEHAIRHLFYARFIHHFLHDIGRTSCREPFSRFLPIGLILGKTYRDAQTGRYLSPNEAAAKKDSSLEITMEKMSKSKLNGIEPAEVVGRLGTDLTRLCMLANTGPHGDRRWEEGQVLKGVEKWQQKLWKLVDLQLHCCSRREETREVSPESLAKLLKAHRRAVRLVTGFYEDSFVLSAVIAQLQTLTDQLRKFAPETSVSGAVGLLEYNRALADLIIMSYPLIPLLACELWAHLLQAWRNTSSRDTLSQIYKMDQPLYNQKFPVF